MLAAPAQLHQAGVCKAATCMTRLGCSLLHMRFNATGKMQELHLQDLLTKAGTAKHRVGDCGQSQS